MSKTNYPGINYAGRNPNINRNSKTGIRFGVISQNEILQAWADDSEADFGNPTCPNCSAVLEDADCDECPACKQEVNPDRVYPEEPLCFTYKNEGYYAKQNGGDGDVFVIDSPYFTYAQFCSPCAPGACYLMSYLEEPIEENKCYCFGHDWFDGGKAPYPVYSVETGKQI